MPDYISLLKHAHEQRLNGAGLEPVSDVYRAMKVDADQYTRREIRSISADWRLPYNPIPKALGGADLSNSDRNTFRKIRSQLAERGLADACWACGLEAEEAKVPLHAHEWWEWNDRTRVRSLVAIRFLCFDCHYLTHQAYWAFLFISTGKDIARIELFCRVNECIPPEAIAHSRDVYAISKRRGEKKWKVDTSPLGSFLLHAFRSESNAK